MLMFFKPTMLLIKPIVHSVDIYQTHLYAVLMFIKANCTQVPGGRLAEVFGTKRVMGFCTYVLISFLFLDILI